MAIKAGFIRSVKISSYLPDAVEHFSIRVYSNVKIWHNNFMDVPFLLIGKKQVRHPNFLRVRQRQVRNVTFLDLNSISGRAVNSTQAERNVNYETHFLEVSNV